MYAMAESGDLSGFNSALDALPALSPAELVILHPQSVGLMLHTYLALLSSDIFFNASRAILYSMSSVSKVGSTQRLQC